MTKFEITPALRDIIEKSEIPAELANNLLSNAYISHENLVSFYKDFKPTPTLIALIKSTKHYTPNLNVSNKSTPKSKEFIKSMEQLRLKNKEEEYQRLIRPKQEFNTLYDNGSEEIITPAQAHKELKSQLTTIVNILISVGSVVYAIWYWTDSSMKLQDGYRILLCLFFGILVLVAEVVVYMSYLNKIEEAKVKERNKLEVKKLVRTLE
ncbi:DEHA2G09834p [Debaryomyces hansenii CBS767]|uniref:DEHA2G09834p n=1 Tax=Debaryomyces hansenii (strain ATCC 36239 / CBS 767 / BCRC 21394 / JCM 1990 / NBRC 0083 / IGC 2968) TaxID=284592 RepID=Q6BIJ7_DEBHA|nr:DEHA2G09834p [Debaryomyces hansenii CBS767]CAG90444.2 DEHA2G09834p [Debaryomyces hansenii CBS767]|eukprot:XP_461974.2 DEHA2G09834p [Debaryomyces hansenii CBS767]